MERLDYTIRSMHVKNPVKKALFSRFTLFSRLFTCIWHPYFTCVWNFAQWNMHIFTCILHTASHVNSHWFAIRFHMLLHIRFHLNFTSKISVNGYRISHGFSHKFNPLNPGAFCEKGFFLGILVVFRLDLGHITSNLVKNALVSGTAQHFCDWGG